MDVEMHYTDGCPHAEAYLPHLRALLSAQGVNQPVRLRTVTSAEQAQGERFLGSPTIRINGRDVDPTAERRRDYGLTCRLYTGPDGQRGGTPPDEWVLAVLAPRPADDTEH